MAWRGVAALLIIWHHFMQFTPVSEFWLSHFAGCWDFPRVGVDLFFVLSGFLITGILFDSRLGEHYFRTFYKKSSSNFPIVLCVLVIVLLILPLMGTQTGVAPSSHIFWTNKQFLLRIEWMASNYPPISGRSRSRSNSISCGLL